MTGGSLTVEDPRISIARIPLRRSFGHATAHRTTSESVLLTLRAARSGLSGWGEAAPRSYVTGESLSSVATALSGVDLRGWDFGGELSAGIATIDSFMGRFDSQRASAPAARAALETALLDVVCRHHDVAMADALAGICGVLQERRRREFPVSVVVDSTRDRTPTRPQPRAVVKVKVGSDVRRSLIRLRELSSDLPSSVRVAADANGSWDVEDALSHADELRSLGLAWVEEPFRRRAFADMSRLERSGVPVMLDESFTVEDDLVTASEHRLSFVNVRVSKCGGPLACLRMITRARELGVRFQLGVQVAEIGPLWATGRALMSVLHDAETFEGGRQDEWFAPALTWPPYERDERRSLVRSVTGAGHGVVPSSALLQQLDTIEEKEDEG